mmetsp:Transcript_11970/g.38293  ORF Transcript_11970/g.38293 Transcript_11970/m.38293 type:complete len:474 (-) Transcript_11970:111-1532(-)
MRQPCHDPLHPLANAEGHTRGRPGGRAGRGHDSVHAEAGQRLGDFVHGELGAAAAAAQHVEVDGGLRVPHGRDGDGHLLRRQLGVHHERLVLKHATICGKGNHAADRRIGAQRHAELDAASLMGGLSPHQHPRVPWKRARSTLTRLCMLDCRAQRADLLLHLLLPPQQLLHRLRLRMRVHQPGPGPSAADQLRRRGQVASELALHRTAHDLLPAVQPVVRLHQRGHLGAHAILVHELTVLVVSDLDLAVRPATAQLRDVIRVQVEATDGGHMMLELDAPDALGAVVDANRAIGQRVPIACQSQWGEADNLVRLGDFRHNVLLLEDADLVVFRAHQQLVHSIILDIAKREGGDIVASHRPKHLVALVVEALDRAVPSHNGQGRRNARHVPKDERVHTIRNVLEKQVAILLHVVRHQARRRAHQHQVATQTGLERTGCHGRDSPVDVQKPDWRSICIILLVRTVQEDLPRTRSTR